MNSPTDPVRDQFLVFGAPVLSKDEIAEVVASMEAGWIGTGPKVAQFERAFLDYHKGSHAVAVNSCTAALHLSLLGAGIKPGDEVITTPLTFCATINAIIHAGGVPVLADVDPVTMNIDPAEVEARITSRTRAMVPVHFAGRACAMDALQRIAREHDLKIVEDCAHAVETTYRGQSAGTFGDFGCFSFYVTKNITTAEGGMVVTRDREDAERIKRLALHGLSHDAWKRFGDDGYKHYYVEDCGFKYNMTDLQAAIGLHQLKQIKAFREKRARIWEAYNQAFADCPVTRPAPTEPDTEHAFHLYTLLIDTEQAGISRDQVLDAMTYHQIGVGVHYLSIPEHPYYRETYGWDPDMFPHARRIGRQTISLPMSPGLSEKDLQDVIRAVRLVLKKDA